jgi:PAS domain S-box-containing protein
MALSSIESMSIGNSGKNLPRLFAMGSLVVTAVLAAFVSLAIYRFNSFQEVWVAHSKEATRISETLASFNRSMGYGGLIHNFNNLVLRGDLERYSDVIEGNLFDLKNELAHLGALLKTKEDQDDLAVIRDVVASYDEKVALVFEMVEQGRTPVEIDSMVKVNDTPSLEAMGRLIARLQPRADAAKAEADRIKSEAERALLIGGAFLLGMVAFVTALLIHFTRRLVTANSEVLFARKRVDDLLDEAPDAMVHVTPDGSIVRTNRQAQVLFGYSAAEMGALSIEDLLPERYRSKTPGQPTIFFAFPTQRSQDGTNQRQVLTKDGREPYVEINLGNSGSGDDQIVTAIIRDVSAQVELRESLQRASEAAQAASLSKSQFLANMSHELRTPMNAILGMLTLLRKTELTTRQADYAAKSDGAARALLGLLNEILDFSKIEAGKMTLDPHPFAVDHLLRDLSTILSTNVGEKPVEVLFDIDPLLPRLLVGDSMRLQQVLLNLASNAIKFTAQGEVVLSIKVMLCTDDVVTAQFSMRDSGIGIAPENQARIFSGFTQAESSTTRKYGGTGLGVAISQRFVNMMGGELELESEVGKGSRFYFTVTLPIATQADETERARMPERAQGASWRTLVIDDNAIAREVLEHMGQSLGWQVDLAESGEQALALLRESASQGIQYQAIFVDWSMPEMDGWQTSQNIRALQAQNASAAPSDKAPVVLMVTSHGREMLSQRSASDQALLDGFLVKPVTASMLLDAVIDARASHDHTHPSRMVTQTAERRLDGMRLLLVEDNLNNQQVARELLEDEGAVVQIANHGQEAVEAIAAAIGAGDGSEQAFDVVLMDLQMPVMDGFAAARAIRQDLCQTALPIVAMTANAMASDREACLAVGMNDHVGKPFDLNDLVRVLRRQAQRDDVLPISAHTGMVLSATATQAASDAGVDIAAALKRLGGKQDVYRRMLKTFVQDTQRMPEQLQSQEAAPNDIKRMLHTLKGLAATMGAVALAEAAAIAEKLVAGTPTPEQRVAATLQAIDAIALAMPGLQTLLAALEHDQSLAEVNDAGASQQVLDRPALLEALRAMEQYLQDGDMEAMNAMGQLQQEFGATLGDALEPLEAAMADLEFDKALQCCVALREKYAS